MPLHYRDEHVSCQFYADQHTALFKQMSFAAGETFPAINKEFNNIAYIYSGTMEVSIGGYPAYTATEGTLIFIPQNLAFHGHANDSLSLCTCKVDNYMPLCSRYDFIDLRKNIQNLHKEKYIPPTDTFPRIIANEQLRAFFTDLHRNRTEGMDCIHYHEIKRKELFILLRAYYTKQELFEFFFPIIGLDNNFREFIYQNYKKASDVRELAELAHMTVRSFQRRFKNEFFCTPREWLIARCAEAVLHDLRTTDKDLLSIATENGFTSMSHFSTFCKQRLGMTPTKLRKQRTQNQTAR